jgi:hypothetical protein
MPGTIERFLSRQSFDFAPQRILLNIARASQIPGTDIISSIGVEGTASSRSFCRVYKKGPNSPLTGFPGQVDSIDSLRD